MPTAKNTKTLTLNQQSEYHNLISNILTEISFLIQQGDYIQASLLAETYRNLPTIVSGQLPMTLEHFRDTTVRRYEETFGSLGIHHNENQMVRITGLIEADLETANQRELLESIAKGKSAFNFGAMSRQPEVNQDAAAELVTLAARGFIRIEAVERTENKFTLICCVLTEKGRAAVLADYRQIK